MTAYVGCDLCFGRNAVTTWAYYTEEHGLPVEHEVVADPHFDVQIRRCAACGQPFLFVFIENVDWVGGDDTQTANVVPVTAAEAAEVVAGPDLERLGSLGEGRRRLFYGKPARGEPVVVWASGPFEISPYG